MLSDTCKLSGDRRCLTGLTQQGAGEKTGEGDCRKGTSPRQQSEGLSSRTNNEQRHWLAV